MNRDLLPDGPAGESVVNPGRVRIHVQAYIPFTGHMQDLGTVYEDPDAAIEHFKGAGYTVTGKQILDESGNMILTLAKAGKMRIGRHQISNPSEPTTPSGKIVPLIHDPIYHNKRKWPKYNVPISPLSAHGIEAGKILQERLPSWTKEDHLYAADYYEERAKEWRQKWAEIAKEAAQATFGRPYQFTDYKIAGIARDEFPEKYKEQLRMYAADAGQASAAAYAHRQAMRLRIAKNPARVSSWKHDVVSKHEPEYREGYKAALISDSEASKVPPPYASGSEENAAWIYGWNDAPTSDDVEYAAEYRRWVTGNGAGRNPRYDRVEIVINPANPVWGLGKLPPNALIEHRPGVWGFVGSVDGRLAYVRKDGSEPTQEEFKSARIVGPGMAGLRSRVWLTKADAVRAAEDLGLQVTFPVSKQNPAEGWAAIVYRVTATRKRRGHQMLQHDYAAHILYGPYEDVDVAVKAGEEYAQQIGVKPDVGVIPVSKLDDFFATTAKHIARENPYRAGVPYTLYVQTPQVGKHYYATPGGESGDKVYKLSYLGVVGSFDRIPIHQFKWLAGPKKGQTEQSYSQTFWKKPATKAERKQIMDELGEWEINKLKSGGYPPLTYEKMSNPEDWPQAAFDAGKDWRLSGDYYTSGVADARVVRYGFIKWWNNFTIPQTKGVKKASMERAFREGYAAGKRIEKRPDRSLAAAEIRESGLGRGLRKDNPEDHGIQLVLGIRGKGASRVSETQSVTFDKSMWKTADAREWLKEHGYKTPAVDVTKGKLRFRQESPRKYQSFATIVPGEQRNPPTRRIHQFGPQAARLLINEVPVATIGLNLFADPFYASSKDFRGDALNTDEKFYFRTWKEAMQWLENYDREESEA